MEMEHGIESNTQLVTQSTSSLPTSSDPNIEGLVSITSSPSSSGSFELLQELNNVELLQELNNAKDSEDQMLEKESFNSTKSEPIEDFTQDKQSPPIQAMGRPHHNPGYDPNRIPSSVFASKPASPMDWSVASNESLFSIHMGNNSFSRDHAILMMGKSGELYNFDDLISNVPGQLPKPNEINNFQYNLPTVVEINPDVENCRASVSVEKEDFNLRKDADITPKASMKVNLEGLSKETPSYYNSSNNLYGRETPTRASSHLLSNECGTTSSSSFAFPLLTSDCGSYHKVKVANENIQPRPIEKPMREPELESEPELEPDLKPHKPTPKTDGIKWFSWLSWCHFRPFSFCITSRCSFCS